MQEVDYSLGAFGVLWRLAATLLFVSLNAFFVAAEFALVKVSRARLDVLVQEGRRSAITARHLQEHLDLYLTACQLGITAASLALGWLGEPAVAGLLFAGLQEIGIHVSPDSPVIRIAAFALAFAAITVVHMVLGEQAPKMWAGKRDETTALATAGGVRTFPALGPPLGLVIK